MAMKCLLVFTLFLATSLALPLQLLQLGDLFAGVEQQQRARQQDVVKRQVEANADGQLKQISFHGLIGDLENSLFESAISLHGASAPDSEITEIKPGQSEEDPDHAITKRSDESTPTTDSPQSTTDDAALARKILLQTTRKVPSNDDVPAHLIIDHVSVQPHNGGSVPLIPTFQVHHTKVISIKEDASGDDSTDGKHTKISITKTSITSTAPVEPNVDSLSTSSTQTDDLSSSSSSSSSSTTTTKEQNESTTEISSSSTDTTSSTTTASKITILTTEQPLEKLKKDEEKLKEKVAEVEAVPVILATRV